MAKKPEFSPGFEPTPDVTDADLDDPTAIAAAPVAAPAAPVASTGDISALIAALTGLVSQLNGQIGAQNTAAVLAEMGSKVISVTPIDVPAFVLANVKGFDQTPHFLVKDEVRYPQMGDRAPLVRTRGLPIEKCTELGIDTTKV